MNDRVGQLRQKVGVEPIITSAELAAMLGRPTLRIVDASWHLDARDGAAEFVAAHIAGAVFFDIDAISDRTSPLPHMLPPAEQFAIQVGALGISDGDDVVVYDNSPTRSAARAWWSFRVMGFDRVRVLDGGLQKWTEDGFPVETGKGNFPPAASLLPRWRPELVRSLDQVRRDVEGDPQILDARPAPRFRGEAPEPRPGLRAGRMPGALNLPLSALYNPEGTLRSKVDLVRSFEDAGVDLSRPITATCGSGVAASSIALALEVLGHANAAVYDGSWAEWGARDDTVVATGPCAPQIRQAIARSTSQAHHRPACSPLQAFVAPAGPDPAYHRLSGPRQWCAQPASRVDRTDETRNNIGENLVNSPAATPSLDGMAITPLASDQAPLPRAPVAESYDHRETERRLAARWEELGLHRFEPASTKPIFSVDTPPPYVSAAHLHVGHAMSYSQAEFVIRFKRMTGHNIFYPMGFDDNGLPTERFVEKKYGLNKRNTTRAEFRALCIEETQAGAQAYEEMWRSLGLSVDWRQRYSTIDSHSTATAQRSFLDLHHKGLLYRSNDPVYWDTVDETSLAQADLEPVTRKSKLFDIAFSGPDGCQLIISTTRPELLPGCVALAYHPGDERHAALEGLSARVPLFDFAVPILRSKDVDPKYGTGLMMICTFGDNDDVKKWRDLKLATRLVIDSRGRMTEDAGRFAGMPVAEARAQIVKDLAAEGLLCGHRVVDQSVAMGERSGQPVEFQMAPQWFIRILDRQEELLARANELQWHPPHMKTRLDQWIDGLKYDWNISRQRFYGVPLPVWYVQETGDIVVADEADLPVDPTRDPPPSWAREKYAGMTIVGDSDVMDTWMTSSLSPLINMNWAGTPGRDGAPSMLPMSLRIQAFEIIRTWLFYTMVKSHFHSDALPWTAAMISGWGLNEQGRKISKRDLDEFTDADGYCRYDPKAVIDRYGADALRFWAAGAKLGHDLRYNEKDVRAGRKVVVKLWNVARLCEMYLSDFDPDTDEVALEARPLEDRWLEARFAEVVRIVTGAFESFDYAAGREAFEKFFWATLCDNYLEIVKDRLWRPEVHGTSSRKAAQTTLWHILRGLLGLAAPYIPFVTDDIYLRHYAERERQSSLHATAWPQAGAAELDEHDELSMSAVLDTLDMLRQVRGHTKLPAGPWSKLVLEIPKADWGHLQPARRTLLAAMRCDAIERGSGRYAGAREGWSLDVYP